MDTKASSCRRCMRPGGVVAAKWVVSKTGPFTSTRSPVHGLSSDSTRDNHKHFGYVAVLAVAAGMLTIICFYVCVWLVRQSRNRVLESAPGGTGAAGDVAGVTASEKTEGRGGQAEGEQQKWHAGAVELVLMAGEDVPTFLAHPAPAPASSHIVIQCPPSSIPLLDSSVASSQPALHLQPGHQFPSGSQSVMVESRSLV